MLIWVLLSLKDPFSLLIVFKKKWMAICQVYSHSKYLKEVFWIFYSFLQFWLNLFQNFPKFLALLFLFFPNFLPFFSCQRGHSVPLPRACYALEPVQTGRGRINMSWFKILIKYLLFGSCQFLLRFFPAIKINMVCQVSVSAKSMMESLCDWQRDLIWRVSTDTQALTGKRVWGLCLGSNYPLPHRWQKDFQRGGGKFWKSKMAIKTGALVPAVMLACWGVWRGCAPLRSSSFFENVVLNEAIWCIFFFIMLNI